MNRRFPYIDINLLYHKSIFFKLYFVTLYFEYEDHARSLNLLFVLHLP